MWVRFPLRAQKRYTVCMHKDGFTLIELLVVIAIIGLLSSVTLASLDGARVKARDAARIAAVHEIQKAIELYALDNNGTYPGYGGSGGVGSYTRSTAATVDVGSPMSKCGYGAPGTPGANSGYAPGIWCRLESALAPYIDELPSTANETGPFYAFYYKVPSTNLTRNPNRVKDYGLSVRLERANDASRNDGGRRDDHYEVGGLVPYCTAQNSDWNSWASNPCSCTVYYSSGCVY